MRLDVFAQIVGGLGIICSLLSFQFKSRQTVLGFQMCGSALFCAQLFMVGAVTGGCVDSISFVRTAIFSQNSKKWASSPLWLYFFILAMIVTGIMTWENAWSVLPIIGSILSTIAMWMKKSSLIRLISLFVGPCWLIYNVVYGAWTGAINEVLAMTSIVIGIIRCDIKKRTYKKEN